jgi:hypothetical protein
MTVRLPNSLHHRLEELAQEEHVSLNHLVVYELTRATSSLYDVSLATSRQREADRRGWKAFTDRLPKANVRGVKDALGRLRARKNAAGKRRRGSASRATSAVRTDAHAP